MLSTLLGTRLTLWLGPGVPIPAPLPVTEALRNVEVTQVTAGRDGFQLTFTLPRGPFDIVDYSLLANPLLRPFSRVIVQVWSGPVPQVLIDGVITHHQIAPEDTGSGATLTVTGEDLRVLMDLREIPMIYPQMTPEARVFLILAKYAVFIGGAPIVIPVRIPDVPLLIDRIPSQAGTDLAYVQRLAEDHGYVFYLEPTPVPMVNLAYWGPENRLSIPQPALSVNLGPQTNVSSLNFRYDALQPETVLGVMQERRTRAPLPVVTVTGLKPPLALVAGDGNPGALRAQRPVARIQQARRTAGLRPRAGVDRSGRRCRDGRGRAGHPSLRQHPAGATDRRRARGRRPARRVLLRQQSDAQDSSQGRIHNISPWHGKGWARCRR